VRRLYFDVVSVKTPSKRRTDGGTRRRVSSSVRPSVRSFVSVRCVCQRRPSYGGTNRDASYKFKGEIKILDKPINTRNLVS